jgi:uncharacterized protein YacL
MIDNDKQLHILPNSSLILALGVLSIFFFCFAGIVSLIMGIIALILANQANQLYKETPRAYTLKSVQNVNTGKTCAIIGLMLSAISLLITVIAILFGLGIAFSFLPFCL